MTPSNPPVAKIFLVPVKRDENGKRKVEQRFASYTAHMDIGACCFDTEIKPKHWQKRKSEPQKGVRKTARESA